MTASPETRRYLISGRVQGVGFRAFTRRTARDLGLTGWVKNLPDGRVEAVVSGEAGDAATLDELESRLRRGPRAGRVDDLSVSAIDFQSFDDFEVRR